MEILFASKNSFHYLLSFLHPYEIANLIFCSKTWKKNLDEDNTLWKMLMWREGLIIPEELKETVFEKLKAKEIFVSYWNTFKKKVTKFALLNLPEEEYCKKLKTSKDRGLEGKVNIW